MSNISLGWRRLASGKRTGACFCALLLAVLASTAGSLRAVVPPETLTLSATVPLGASPGIRVFIVGTGFDPVPINNTVTLIPPTGAPVSAVGLSLAAVDADKGLKRLEFKMPDGLPVGPVTVQVRIGKSGPIASGVTMQVVDVVIPQPVTAARGSTVAVRFLGSPNTTFADGGTTITSDGRVSVVAMQFVSLTEIVATVAVKDTAALGPRLFMLTSPRQGALVRTGFQVVSAAPANRPPTGEIGGPYSGTVGSTIPFSSSGSSDPDGDALQYRWDFGDGASSTEANPQHTFASAGVFAVTLSLADGRGGAASAVTTATIAAPVVLTALEVSPPEIRFAELGRTAALAVTGQYSDGASRDLTHDSGTTFSVDPSAVASVSSEGVVTAVAAGSAVVTTRHGVRSTTTPVQVVITSGAGFLRGETFDDTRGVPLAGATATLMIAGGTDLAPPQVIAADDRGRFALPTLVGAALVRIDRGGFTAVERQASPASGSVVTLLDARLTPLDGRVNLLQSVFGGEARSTDGSASVTIPPGGLDQDAAIRVTLLSNQGLQGLLPAGWSPIAAVDLQPAGRAFSPPATLRLPHVDTLAIGAAVTVARYDAGAHQWVAHATGHVSDDRRTITAPISSTGQYAMVIPDDQPTAPPSATPGQPLAGLSAAIVPESATVTGSVLPRSAPPGEGARAVGTIVLEPPSPLSSGVVLRARVTEQFDLLDTSRVVPLPFVQDVVLFARPRVEGAGTLAARIPITPSLQFTIQQLSLGTVRLDVTTGEPLANNTIVGTAGGTIDDEGGNRLEVPAGSLSSNVAVGLRPLTADRLSAGVPSGFTLLGAVFVEMVGASFNQPAGLSIPRPASLDQSAQVIAAEVMTDFTGGRRLKIVGVGEISASRVALQTTLAAHTFEGVRTGGEFLFLQPAQPLGFVTGRVVGAGAAPQALSLVTASTAPFAFMTGGDGAFVVAGRPSIVTNLTAIESAGATASGSTVVAAANALVAVNLTLAQTPLTVIATDPAASSANVALDAPLVIDFSKPIDQTTVTAASVVLRSGTNIVSTIASLSANRRRLTITPGAPLQGLTTHTLTLTAAIRDLAGVELAALAPLVFTTIDSSKPAVLALGLVTADLPDEDGLSLVTGGPGATEPNSVVVVTNDRTQEAVTVLSAADGSFRLRVNVLVGDSISLTFRDPAGRVTTVAITQFTALDGSTAIGSAGGSVQDGSGRVGRVLPRALASAGIFALESSIEPLPSLPASFVVLDQFALQTGAAEFKRLDSLTLTEGQGRFAPGSAFTGPFVTTGTLTVPADFLVTASLRFNAEAIDREGARHDADGTTAVVATTPDLQAVESAFGDSFPTVFLTAPRQAIPGQVVDVAAVAPAARLELDMPTTATPPADHTVLLARVIAVGGEAKLSIVDRMVRTESNGLARLRTNGRELPGATRNGSYAVISGAIALVSGRVNGPAALVSVEGLPFAFETDGANGRFTVPVVPNAPFVLRFTNASTGGSLGTAAGTAAPAGQATDLGTPLAPVSALLTAASEPNANSVVDISSPIVVRFSEAVDRSTVTPSSIIVTDPSGTRTFGRVAIAEDGRTVVFSPLRRWKYGTRYRYGIATTVVAASGARLAQTVTAEFTTFNPSSIGTAATGMASSVAVAGAIAVVAGATGIQVVDVTTASAPAIVSQLPIVGGARGVARVGSPIVARNGAVFSGALVAVVTGDAGTGARLQVYDLTNAAAPTLLGSATLGAGTPRAVVVTPDQRALVAMEGAGLIAVHLGTVIPNDPANPTQAIVGRYPATGTENIVGVSFIAGRIVTTGAQGLTVLNGLTLARTGGLSGSLDDVALIGGLTFDIDGDGSIAQDDTFDVAVATDRTTNTLQLIRVPSEGDPSLLSAVRLPASPNGVAVDAAEALAYVSIGARGAALIDLLGPASIQPVDLNRDGTDDRILGVADTPVSAQRVTPMLSRGLGLVADGDGGIHVLRLLPPRVRFLDVLRDPVMALAGEEQSIVTSKTAFVSDDAVRFEINADLGNDASAFLTIEETPPAGGNRLLSFANASGVATLQPGLNSVTIAIAGVGSPGTRARFSVRRQTGEVVASWDLVVALPPASASRLEAIFVGPPSAVIGGSDADDLALGVAGLFQGGLVLNLTRATTGTTYRVDRQEIASASADGVITALAGGETQVVVANDDREAAFSLAVERAPVLVALEAMSPAVSLRAIGAAQPIPVVGVFSNGSRQPASAIAGTSFASSDSQVAEISAAGVITANGPGETVVRAVSAALQATVLVLSEPRAPPQVSAIQLILPVTPVDVDAGEATIGANVTGTGSLDGLLVTIATSGVRSAQFTASTTLSGATSHVVDQLSSPGGLVVTATVVDPASGATRSDTQTLAILPPADAEPNNSIANAAPLSSEAVVAGSIGGGDSSDVYRLPSALPGTSAVLLTLADDAEAAGVEVVARSSGGGELARFAAHAAGDESPIALPPGTAFVSIESSGGGGGYALELQFDQSPVSIASVTPLSGGGGTPVTIDGAGFGTDSARVDVSFGGILGTVVSVTSTRIQALVPGTGADGPIKVVAGSRDATGPTFTTGNGPRPLAAVNPVQPSSVVVDPSTNANTLIDRLVVTISPQATRAEVQALSAQAGAVIAGIIPSLHVYDLEFVGNRSLNALQAARNALRLNPIVESATFAAFFRNDSVRLDIRTLGASGDINAFEQVKLPDAVDAIRSSPAFQNRDGLRTVRVAIIDDGFKPGTHASEFESPAGSSVREFISVTQGFVPRPANLPTPDGRHGTMVTSVIAAINNGQRASGVLNGVVQPGERPFQVDKYSVGGAGGTYHETELLEAVEAVAAGNYDIVSMSFSEDTRDSADAQVALARAQRFEQALRGAAQTLFVSSAGNDGVDATHRLPCRLSRLPNVMCIGAVATATNFDHTNDRKDARSDFNDLATPVGRTPCDRQHPVEGSNCGRVLSLAAPGEDVLTVFKEGGYGYFSGTSAATPMVAGVAALLQAIRPEETPRIAPDRLKHLLIATGDNISAISRTWGRPGIRRLNALSAVRVQLGSARAQKIYVTDDDAAGLGFVVGIEIDPLTGIRRASPAVDARLPLVDRVDDELAIQMLRPSTVVNAGDLDRMFIAVGTDGPLGDGIAEINTHSFEVVAFIPLNGIIPGDPNPSAAPPVKFGTRRPGLALAKDQRLLYVATTDRLVIIDLVESRVVMQYQQLPNPYRPSPALIPVTALANRLDAIRTLLGPNKTIADIAISADGKTLFLAGKTGSGPGLQPGFVLPINIDLSNDASPAELLQADLSNYLRVGISGSLSGPAGAMNFLVGDEPTAIATSPDGRHLYLVNGGLKEFSTVPPAEINVIERYQGLVNQLIIGAATGGGGLAGLFNSAIAFNTRFEHVMNELLLDLRVQAESGLTLINAAGVTGTFDIAPSANVPGTVGSQQWAFTSDVAFGWNPPADNGGRIVNQFRFRDVFAKRPFGLAISPTGHRAIMPLFQTGNFGVLDLATQSRFGNADAAGLAPTIFSGVVAVTPAIRLDNHLWPRRGAYTSAGETFVPSPDEDLLFPGPVEYAQNGRFAAAIHTGVSRPRTVTAALPDFERDNAARLSLNSIGFAVDPGSPSGTDPEGRTVQSFEAYPFQRGGGALTVLHDDRLGIGLDANAALEVESPTGGSRPFFSQNPICLDQAAPATQCATEVFTRHFDYLDGSQRARFSRPRGVSVQPFVSIETPRFGEYVSPSTPVRFRWRDTRGERVRISVHDLGTAASPLPSPDLVNQTQRALSLAERQQQAVARTFASLFPANRRPVDNRNYRITFTAITATGDELASISIDVFFER